MQLSAVDMSPIDKKHFYILKYYKHNNQEMEGGWTLVDFEYICDSTYRRYQLSEDWILSCWDAKSE